jgi:hypothetical protein
MPIRTTLEWPDPDDSGETESFSDALFLEFTDAAPSDANSGTTTESCSSLLVEFSDRDCERRSFNQDEPS